MMDSNGVLVWCSTFVPHISSYAARPQLMLPTAAHIVERLSTAPLTFCNFHRSLLHIAVAAHCLHLC